MVLMSPADWEALIRTCLDTPEWGEELVCKVRGKRLSYLEAGRLREACFLPPGLPVLSLPSCSPYMSYPDFPQAVLLQLSWTITVCSMESYSFTDI